MLQLIPGKLAAQSCPDDYYVVNLPTPTVQNIAATSFVNEDEIIFTGTVLRDNSILFGGWLTKLSSQGTVLWSKRYASGVYSDIHFSKVIPLADGNYIVTGSVGNVDTTVNPPAQLTLAGMLLKMDKYGNIIWSKVFSKDGISELSTSIADIIVAPNGDLIIVLNYSGANNSSIILRTDSDGKIIWTSTFSYMYSTENGGFFSSSKAGFLKNGNIVIGERISIYGINTPYQNIRDGYHLCSLDFVTGNILWDRAFIYDASQSTRAPAFGRVTNVMELPDGDISFLTSFADTAFYLYRTTKEVLNFTTDKVGHLKYIQGYGNDKPPIYNSATAETGTAGERVLLMDNADAPQMMKIDASGKILWQKAYAKTGRSQETISLLNNHNGNYFFTFTHNGGSQDLKMVKTDGQGNADCVGSDLSLTTNDRTSFFKEESTGLKTDLRFAKWYSITAISVAEYRLASDIVCKKTCCEDMVAPVQAIDLCNAVSYTLPNGDVISNNGSYDLLYKSAYGCDSIQIYNVTFSTSPVVELGPNTCFGEKDSLILKTESGYPVYIWNNISTSSNSLVVKDTGKYTVSVTNACGTKKDTVEVFRDCEFDIYMPNAFTPNFDGHNDYFRIPAQINNQLISFSIYNRWGQQIFVTKDKSRAWNGMLHEYPAPAGTYVYVIVMRSLDNKKDLVKKGYVTLIR